jgi:hypothetical protein
MRTSMTPLNSTLLVIFGVVSYLMIVDENVADYLILVFKMTKMNIERMFWMIRLHPKNPITNMMMKWKYDQIARELERELQSKDS